MATAPEARGSELVGDGAGRRHGEGRGHRAREGARAALTKAGDGSLDGSSLPTPGSAYGVTRRRLCLGSPPLLGVGRLGQGRPGAHDRRRWPPPSASAFGLRDHPFDGHLARHAGVDLARGGRERPGGGGRRGAAGGRHGGGYGEAGRDRPWRRMTTLYGHASELLVHEGNEATPVKRSPGSDTQGGHRTPRSIRAASGRQGRGSRALLIGRVKRDPWRLGPC